MRVEAVTGDHPTGASSKNVSQEIVVLKFGSSVLRRPEDLPSVVTEIYRYARAGRGVVAVVSAFAGETDALVEEAAAFGADAASRHAPRFIGLGEERAAALLAIACDAAGLNAVVAGARRLGLTAAGPVSDAYPESVDREALITAIDAHDVVITPGFVAVGPTGEPVLLGRGGSDLTAVVLADAVNAPRATLIKDVDGVYDRDPAKAAPGEALRYSDLDWARAREIAGQLLQPKAIEFAETRNVPLNVARLGVDRGTLVSSVGADPAKAQRQAPLKVAVAGLGVIGNALVHRLLAAPERYDITGILVSNGKKARDRQINPTLLTTQADRLFEGQPDVVIDVLSSGAAGRALLGKALENGVSAVSANKQAVADSIKDLSALANQNGALLSFSSSVGGGAPMVETVRRARQNGLRLKRFKAVLNGTINYILTAQESGASFEDALIAAQKAGFAEADPSADLSGADAVAKIKILCQEAFDQSPAHIEIEALTPSRAAEFAASKEPWRQIAEATVTEDGAINARLSYAVATPGAVFADLKGEENALWLESADNRHQAVVCRGRGAGPIPTVESVLADLGDIERALIRAKK